MMAVRHFSNNVSNRDPSISNYYQKNLKSQDLTPLAKLGTVGTSLQGKCFGMPVLENRFESLGLRVLNRALFAHKRGTKYRSHQFLKLEVMDLTTLHH